MTADVGPMDWMAEASCTQVDPELFFPEKGSGTHTARGICRACPVLDLCAAYTELLEAAPGPPLAGVWANTSPRDRANARRRERGVAHTGNTP